MMQKDFRPMAAGFLVAIIFGFSFLFTKSGLELVTPYHLLALRFGAALALFIALRLTGLIKLNFKGKKIYPLIGLSILEPILYFIGETIGISLTSSSEAGMIIALVPVATTLLAIFMLKERPPLKQLAFIMLSVAGIFFIIFMKGNTQLGSNILGIYVLLAAVVAAALYNVFSRKLSAEFSPVEITYVMMWVGAVFFNGVSIIQHIIAGNLNEYFKPFGNWGVLITIIYLGLLSSVVAYFMFNFMLSKMEASKSSVFMNLSTVFSIIAGVMFANEPFYWYNFVGGMMILLGVWGTNLYSKNQDSVNLSISQNAKDKPNWESGSY